MVTGASTADVAVILVDARKGVLTQTRRHSFIVAMLGIRHVALAVNKMDLVGYDRAVFDRITADYREFAAGLLVLVSFISPFRAERDAARALVAAGEFVEVFVDTPLDVAEGRDRKGLYRKARAGNLPHFTAIDSPYEPPPAPEIRIDTVASSVTESVDQIVGQLRAQGIVP
jgi:hypothetical protein